VKGKDLRLQGGTGLKTGGYQADGATKRELIVEATMIARMVITSAFSDRTEFSVTTESALGIAPHVDRDHVVPTRPRL